MRILKTLSLWIVLCASVSAEEIQVTLDGTITNLGPTPGFWDASIYVGQTFHSTFTLNTSVGDENGAANSGEFRDSSPGAQSTLTAGNYSFVYTNSFVQILNNYTLTIDSVPTVADAYNFAPSSSPTNGVQSGVRNGAFTGQLIFDLNTALTTDQLPVTSFSIDQFNTPTFYFDGEDPASPIDSEGTPVYNAFRGDITSYTVSAVPEPNALPLVVLAALGVFLFRRWSMVAGGKE